jgi:hypothetical protein
VNAYLTRLREKYGGIRASIEGLQERAASENRDLSVEERTSLNNMKTEGGTLYTEIENLTEIEERNAKVAQMDAAIERTIKRKADAGSGGGGKDAVDKDEVYTRSAKYSFFSDHYRATVKGDQEAAKRLVDHQELVKEAEQYRGVTSSTGAGMVAPIWLQDLFAPNLHRRLRVAGRLRQVPFAGPTAWTLGVAGTAADTQTQSTEGTNPTESAPTATVLTVTPKAISGYTDVSRQLLDSGNPAADAILWGDMIGDFYDDAETEVITAIAGQASINVIGPIVGQGTAGVGPFTIAARNAVLDAIAAVSDNSGGDADLFASRGSVWVNYLKILDGAGGTVGRPLIVAERYDAVNNVGRGDNAQGFRSPVQGNMENLEVVTSPSVAAATSFIVNSQELIFSISNPEQFTYREVVGPAEVRVGVWGYCTIITGRRPKAISKITYTT